MANNNLFNHNNTIVHSDFAHILRNLNTYMLILHLTTSMTNESKTSNP